MSCSQLGADEEEEGGTQRITQEHVPDNPDDRRRITLTSAIVVDWWMLLVSQTSCSFCLSWDRVSCTDFKEVSTEGNNMKSAWVFQCGGRKIIPLLLLKLHVHAFIASDLVGKWRRCPAGFSCPRGTVWQ